MKRVTLAQNSQEDKDQALLEVEVLSSLRHPHIVPYKECFWVGVALLFWKLLMVPNFQPDSSFLYRMKMNWIFAW